MGVSVTTITQEFISPGIAPNRLFKALFLEGHDLLPKLLPQFIKSIDRIEGDGGAGSIEQVNFTQSSHYKYAKHRITELDKEGFACKYTMIEGDPLSDKLEFIRYEVKLDGRDGGMSSICKMMSEYHVLGQYEINQEEIKSGKESAVGIYKAVETYLLENPLVYA
ncbi:major strawberry allergen Fra a 1-3-like [Andrographis paniculata]|uniref:major strawberry allergen Fra a 1-3-like n=1 Tax=Andrographis paniculata TaxID=175694 RepID=UPI0021E78347|nr:major strawberry allergen Fra a 1-3-like [Andrographis paniculata]